MSYRIALGLCLLVMGCDASGGVREAKKSVAVGMGMHRTGRPVMVRPNPSDPQCGACSYYLMTERTVYASLDGVENMPRMNLTLYSSSRHVLQRYFGLEPLTYATGKAVYTVPDGAAQDVEYGELGWQSETGYQTQWIPAVSKSLYSAR